MMRIQSSFACLPPGTFEFSPEGYAKASLWMPEDGFSWKDFWKQSPSIEEFESEKVEFEMRVKGKLEVMEDRYEEKSLRTLLPDRWLVAYTSDKAWRNVNGQREPLYSQLKRTLLFKSVVLGYGEGPIHKVLPNNDVAMYIKEHCASSARLKAIALRAYESLANAGGYTTWTSVSQPIFLCLAAAKSSMDAMSSVLWALLFRETPTGKKIPSMRTLYKKLDPKAGTPFHIEFEELHQSSWFTELQLARDSVIHRSASPVAHDKFGAAFDFDLGLFDKMRPTAPRVVVEENMQLLNLHKIMQGFVSDLERWEENVAHRLQELAWFPSLNTHGILMGIDFNDNQLLRDGSGPSLMINSHAQGIESK